MKIYDNSNLSESYAGTTTPLTFSFAKRIYSDVYRYFAGTLGVNKKVINENKEMFDSMVVFIGYHMYYDLNNWYKLISFLPGYKQNKKFFEKMLGVQKQYIDKSQDDKSGKNLFVLLVFFLFRLSKIIFYFLFMGKFVSNFNKYFDRVYKKTEKVNLHLLNAVELKNLFLSLDNQLISKWSIPIVNDFVVMVYSGLADVLARKWLKENNVYNFLFLQSHEKLSSLDPSRQLYDITQKVKKDKNIKALFTQKEENIITCLFEQYPDHQVTKSIKEYLSNFGARSPNELKLETETINEKPTILILILKTILRNSSDSKIEFKREKNNSPQIFKGVSLWKRIILRVLLAATAKAIKNREETRFRRSIIFGYIRKIFLEIGKKLVAKNKLKENNDIFFLSMDEIFNLIDGDSNKFNLEVITLRKLEFSKWTNINCPRRIETENTIKNVETMILNNKFVDIKTNLKTFDLNGTVSSAPEGMSFIEGEALVMKNFDSQGDFKNKILVTKQTDPGWTIIFPFLKGIIVEKGGMLSHASIVARELNIPCVVGVENATELIHNKEKISINLINGKIKHHE